MARGPNARETDREHRDEHTEGLPRRRGDRDRQAGEEQHEEVASHRTRSRPLEEEEVGHGHVVATGGARNRDCERT